MSGAHRVVPALRLAFRVQVAARFPHVYLGVALALALLLRLLGGEWSERLLPVLVLSEPGTLGVYLVAAQRFYARNEGTDVALQVTPLPPRVEVVAPILVTAFLGSVAGLLIQAVVLGVDFRLLLLAPPLFFTVVLSGVIGQHLSAVFSEFTRFILGSIPAMLAFLLPTATLLGWLAPSALVWLPTQWAFAAFRTIVDGPPDGSLWALCTAALLAAAGAGLFLVTGRAERRPAEAIA